MKNLLQKWNSLSLIVRILIGLIIGAIVHNGEVIIPKGTSIIRPNDRIVVFSLAEDTENLRKLFIPGKRGLFSELWNRDKGARDYTAD